MFRRRRTRTALPGAPLPDGFVVMEGIIRMFVPWDPYVQLVRSRRRLVVRSFAHHFTAQDRKLPTSSTSPFISQNSPLYVDKTGDTNPRRHGVRSVRETRQMRPPTYGDLYDSKVRPRVQLVRLPVVSQNPGLVSSVSFQPKQCSMDWSVLYPPCFLQAAHAGL